MSYPRRMTKIMPLGDSITNGYADPAGNGYRADLWQRLYRVGLQPNFVGPRLSGTMGDNNHAGTNGWRIDQVADQALGWIETYQPDVVLLMAGVNDIAQRDTLDVTTAPDRLIQLAWDIRVNFRNVRLFVADVNQFRDPENKPYVDAFNTEVATRVPQMGSAWVHFVPMHGIGTKPGEIADNVHPSVCGYARMSWIWYYYMGRTPLNTTGEPWPTGYYPYGASTGPCQNV